MNDHDELKIAIADRVADVALSEPLIVGHGYMAYERYDVSLRRDDEAPVLLERDILRAGRVVAVLPIDFARGEVVLIRQFRLSAHLATGRGEMIEIVAGRVDDDETPLAAAGRECAEEIGVPASKLVELFSVLPTPGSTDEYVTFFLGFVDASQVPDRSGLADEAEDTRPFVVSIDQAIASLDHGDIANGFLFSSLQWLALHRDRLQEYYGSATIVSSASIETLHSSS